MGKRITLFSGYSQKENRVTNYCLLILKMIYEENPKYLGEILSTISDENISDLVGVKFSQQERKKSSIPDGLIMQTSFSIYIETKNFNWFYDSQLEKHLEALNHENASFKILLALGNFESKEDFKKFESIQFICEEKYKETILFKAITFEDFILALEQLELPKNLSDAILEFEDYLNDNSLLPNWKKYIDVINCAGAPHEILDGNVYMCPAEGGAYNHSRTKYFGMYKDKTVSKVALIKAVIDVDSENEAVLKWNNSDTNNNELVNEAIKKVIKFRPDKYPTRVFLLDTLYETNFVKDTSGGMFGSKQYFDISHLEISSAEDLALKLNSKNWSTYR